MLWELEKKLNLIIKGKFDYVKSSDDNDIIIEDCHDFVKSMLIGFLEWQNKNCELKKNGWFYGHRIHKNEELIDKYLREVLK